MVDFRTLRRREEGPPELDPIEIFRSLPKPEHVNDLWDTQAATLREWYQRREDTDLVIKLNTGSGKTLVGLLICESTRRERELPVLYLTPTRQLADQVVDKATEFGIAAEPYVSGRGLPTAFRNAEAVLVSTYHALFNGRSLFGLAGRGEPVRLGGIVLDDAHSSASIVRDIFSLSIVRSEHEELYRDLAGRFRQAFEQIHALGRIDDMLAGSDEGVQEVPYWAWVDAAPAVREQIQALPGDPFPFVLPLIRDLFGFCHALVSRDSFTITPLLPPVHVLPSYSECPRRVFMSATLADDGLLIRTFGGDPATISRPITTRSVAGLGERMILAPTLSRLGAETAFRAAVELSEEVRASGKGAVVLVPSEAQAAPWGDVGQICIGDDVATAVGRLNDPDSRPGTFPVLVNRYDGIDLPQDACRVLILDGKPRGANLYDLYRGSLLRGINSINISLAQRVEQGMGRGTRGAGDYCVVLLLGTDLVEWLGRREAQLVLTPGTRAQVTLGREIGGHIRDERELLDTARQCLDRDEEWKQVHAQRIAEAGEAPFGADELIAAGRVERRAFEMLLFERGMEACEFLRAEAAAGAWDGAFRGWLLQLAARAAYLAGNHGLAEEIQRDAYGTHRALLKPRGEIHYEPMGRVTPQAHRIVETIEQYAIRSSVLQGIDTALQDLHSEASVNRFEEALRSLGAFLGFESDRPESSTRLGPDNLWLAQSGLAFVIECKHQKTTPVNKSDHGQLRVSVEWFNVHYGDCEAIPVVVHRDGTATSDSQLTESGSRVLTFDSLGRLKAEIKALYRELAFSAEAPDAVEARASALLREHCLTMNQIAERYLRPFERAD